MKNLHKYKAGGRLSIGILLAISLFFVSSNAYAWMNWGSTSWGWICPAPTLEQCQDPDWLQNNLCGSFQLSAIESGKASICMDLLNANADSIAGNLSDMTVAVPAIAGGGTG